ncbi:MAG TPA: hypothetical protein RMH99_15875, partial [Sandaracinaceae bacterium LLY-WYZ-13_1]|nr:hypothetical protein [Sandaracinaceae bacterium LLY-WYZ-13_1]
MRSVTWHLGLIRPAGAVALLLGLALAVGGCRRRQGDEGQQGGDGTTTAGDTADAPLPEPGPPPEDWPRVLVVGPGAGPALYLGPEDDAPAVGYLNPGVRIRMETSFVNDRVEVLVAGALATKGWIPTRRLAAYAQQRGRVEGTRAYLGPNDLVTVLGPADAENMRVEVRPWLGGGNYLEQSFVGTFPREQLADRPVDEAEVEDVSEGECYRLPAGETVPVYESPRDPPIVSLPVLDPPLPVVVLIERGEWKGIRAGYGPYLTGYVDADLTPCEGSLPTPEPAVPAGEEGRPYWMTQESGPLHRVADGTRIRFHDETIARLRADGWARELGRQGDDMVDVFVAVNDQVALRGLVSADSLTLVEGEDNSAPAEGSETEEEEA